MPQPVASRLRFSSLVRLLIVLRSTRFRRHGPQSRATRSPVFPALLALLFLLSGARGEGRLHVLGNDHDGSFPKIQDSAEMGIRKLNLLWELSPCQGFSGMVCRGERIYTQSQATSGQELICISLKSGLIQWRVQYSFPWELDGRYPGPFGAPTLWENRIYFSDCYGSILCANETDGAIHWRFDAVKSLNPGGVDFGYSATPLLKWDLLLAAAPAGDQATSVFALNPRTGKLKWKSGNFRPSYASCRPIRIGGRDVVVLLMRNGVGCFDPETGRKLWADEWTRGYDEHSTWPLWQEPFLICSSPFRRGTRAYRLSSEGANVHGELVWQDKSLSNDIFSSVISGGFLFGYDVQSQQSELLGQTRGAFKCVNLTNGVVQWTNSTVRHCSTLLTGDKLLLLEDEGTVRLVKPDASDWNEIWRAQLSRPGKYWAAPLIAEGRLVVRNRESIACYALADQPGPTSPPVKRESQPWSMSDSILNWISLHRSPALIAPDGASLVTWYLHALALILLSFLMTRRSNSHESRSAYWMGITFCLGPSGSLLISLAEDRIVPVLQISLWSAAYGVLLLSIRARREQSTLTISIARLGAVFLALLCWCYFEFCRWIFFPTGWYFLTGLAFGALPTFLASFKSRRISYLDPFHPATIMFSFNIFYWGSALACWFRPP